MAKARRKGGRRATGAEADGGARRPPLDRDQLIRAALALVDDVGLDGLSMRRLAERLGIKAASLYWYVLDKQELLGLLGDAICGEIRPPDPAAPARFQLEALCTESRRVFLAHRDSARILAATIPSGGNRLRLVDLTLGLLLAAGHDDLNAVRASRVLNDYVTSQVMEESIQSELIPDTPSPDATEGAEFRAAPSIFAPPTAGTYPSIARLAEKLAESDNDGRFEFGLKVLLDGLELQLARNQPRG